ncbi:MAG: hypothetical protein QM207_00405 [Thermobispora sp.]|nr:hypothetical protein [Thermobispora sp.]
MIRTLHKMGVRSSHMYGAGIASIGLTVVSWFLSNRYEHAGIDRADRWGLFIGEWAPTLFAMGIALRREEMQAETERETPEWREQPTEMRRPTRAGV